MEDFTKETFESIIKEGKKVLKKNKADFGPLCITLHKDIYSTLTPDGWVDFLKKHSYKLVVKFVDDKETYKLTPTGELVKEE